MEKFTFLYRKIDKGSDESTFAFWEKLRNLPKKIVGKSIP